MPRDISGNYTLPVGNPVVSGTIIDVAWANPTMSDIATQLNNVLTRDGVLPATNPIRFVDGSASAPSITFTGAPATGIYRSGTTFGVAVAGVSRATVDSAAALTVVPDAAGIARVQVPASAKLQIGSGTGSGLYVDENNLVYLGPSGASNRVGYLGVPRHYQFGGTITSAAVGKIVYDSPVVNYTLNTGVFAAGDSFWILNNDSASSITVAPGGGFTLRFGNRTGTRSIPPYAMAFVHMLSSTEAVVSVIGDLLNTTAMTVAQLPSASAVPNGTRAFVTDATSGTFTAVVAGGGSFGVPCFAAGGTWYVG